MDAILILAIISIQFTLLHFGVKYLSSLNKKIILLNENIELILPKIQPKFEKVRKIFSKINKITNKYFANQDKIKIIKTILLIYSLITAIIVFKKRKNPFNLYSLYDVIIKTTKALLGF